MGYIFFFSSCEPDISTFFFLICDDCDVTYRIVQWIEGDGNPPCACFERFKSVKKKIDIPIWQGELRWTDLPNIDAGRNKQTLSAIESGQRWIDQYNLLSSSPNEKFKHTLQFFEYISVNH